MARSVNMRLRDLGLSVGLGAPGTHNAITDVPGVQVGHATLIEGDGPLVVGKGPVRTGVTVVKPVPGHARATPVTAGAATLNGNGEMTGLEWVRESGLLTTPLAITNTHSVGVVRDALVADDFRRADGLYWSMPVVGETYDGILNDINGQHVTAEHVHQALADANGGPVREGCVGGGTGMIVHGFKGGIGTSSRLATIQGEEYVVGVLVQANHGVRGDLRVDGFPVGRVLGPDVVPVVSPAQILPPGSGSIIIVIATNAPLLPDQCRRLAWRGFVGMSRAGGGCSDSSGDIGIAFSTGAAGQVPPEYVTVPTGSWRVPYLPHQSLSPLFDATSDATEEAILNAALQAVTMTGRDGIVAHALEPQVLLDALSRIRR
ncbi:MAG TPA: P1 family peptidase [Mycobacteriales bacterium]|nr:P1 family peptidase [Mycobacteriales bacterium]